MMADKNQLSLVNGIPQLPAPNSIFTQTNYSLQNQAQMVQSSGVNNSSNTAQMHKPFPTMVNGQLPQANRNLNWQQSGDNSLHQEKTTIAHSLPMPAKFSPTFLGSLPSEHSSNIQSSSGQPNPGVPPVSWKNNVSQHLPFNQTPSDTPAKGNNLRQTPAMGNRPPMPTSSSVQFNPAQQPTEASQMLQNEQLSKANPSPFQYTAKLPIGSVPRLLSHPQINKPLNGPVSNPNVLLKPSPGDKPVTSNTYNSTYASSLSTSHEVNAIQSHNHYQGAYLGSDIHRTQNPNVSQSFLQPFSQPSSLQSDYPTQGMPSQGYQPQIATNQIPLQTSLPNTPLSNDKTPTNNYRNFEHTLPTNQNQFLGSAGLGPPPLRGEMPQPRSTAHQQSTSISRPPLPGGISNYKQLEMNTLKQGMERLSVTQQGYNKLWGMETIDLLQCRNILPPQKVTPPPIRLHQEFMDSVNCSPEIFCCTLNKIPETNSLLQKSRLPLGILIHPFRDLSQLAVIQCSSIVRCRACRTYINPFVYFVDNKRWKCNLCFRVNELPDEFQFDPVSKTYGDPSRRPEIRSSTIEFIAPSEYMLRPPQPAIYLFVLDVSRWGCDSGYLETLCSVLLEELDNIPGDSRTQIGFILFDSTIHFFSIAENYNQAHEMIVTDIDDVFLPTPDSLLVNLNENKQLIKDLLQEIPRKYAESFDTDSALGPALQAAYKLMSPTGGRITVFQSCLPNKGPGCLSFREDQNSLKDVRNLGPQTDFYKRLALDCSTQQISVDVFLVSSQYSDLATLSGVSQFSGGCLYHFPMFRRVNPESNERLIRALRRYLTRKIGFEAVMRVRCSRGLSIHTFHGNFFVRSTDLLSLPNVNPDAGFGMQIAIEDSLFELQCVCFQAAVLYTSAKGERRIRVHTLCLPVSSNLTDILTSADQQAIIGLLSKMAVDRSLKSSLSDAREAFINVALDILSAYKLVETSGGQNTILAPVNLSLIPLYILALLKSTAFRIGQFTKLDDRVYAMSQLKTLPLRELIQSVYPDLYNVTHLDDQTGVEFEDKMVAQPARLSLSSEHLDSRGAFLLDTPEVVYLLVGKNISPEFLINIFSVKDIRNIDKDMVDLPELENEANEKLRHFINYLQMEKPWPAVIKIVTEPNSLTPFFIHDKAENALSYYELLHHVKARLK